MASIEQLSANSFRITVSDGFNSSGKRLRPRKTVTLPEGMTERQRKKELNRQAVLFEQEVASGTYLDASKMTLGDFTQRWLVVYAEENLAPGTLRSYKIRIENQILPALGHIKLFKLQPHHLMEFYSNLRKGVRLDALYAPTAILIDTLNVHSSRELSRLSGLTPRTCRNIQSGGQTNRKAAEKLCSALDINMRNMFTIAEGKKLSEKTIRLYHGTISSILSTAVGWGVLTSNPANRVNLGKMPKYKPSYYDDEQVADMFIALENEPMKYKTMVYVALDTGIRESELTGLRWQNFDLDNGLDIESVTIERQRQYVSGYGIIVRDKAKSDSGERAITMSNTVTNMLREYREHQKENFSILGLPWNPNGYVFAHENGEPMHPQRPYKWLTAFLARRGLPKITFHQLRHTNSSLLIAAGVDIVTLSARLGHADPNITLKAYSHVIKNQEAKVANRMDELYSRASKKE